MRLSSLQVWKTLCGSCFTSYPAAVWCGHCLLTQHLRLHRSQILLWHLNFWHYCKCICHRWVENSQLNRKPSSDTPSILAPAVKSTSWHCMHLTVTLKKLDWYSINRKSEMTYFLFVCFEGGEWSDSSKFALCTIICHSFYPLGLIILSGIAYLIRNWRILQLVLFSPLVLVLGIYFWYADTSGCLDALYQKSQQQKK